MNCSVCHKGEIFNVKRGLCRSCYTRMCNHGELTVMPGEYPQYREMEFVKNFFNHKNWISQPAILCRSCYTRMCKFEIVRILKEIIKKIENGKTNGTIFDINGNTVGEWKL